MKFIYKYRSPNFNQRKKGDKISLIILHYTALKDSDEALRYLCEKKNRVSTHFLINKKGKIYYLVNTSYRAWHAGKSFWKGNIDINSKSIGIELDNSGHHHFFENYSYKQINSLISLLTFLFSKFSLNKYNVLGHSDVAPYRKIDPGEKFPWKKLEKNKLSFVPKKLTKSKLYKIEKLLASNVLKNRKQKSLYILDKIGYDTKHAKSQKEKYYMLIKAYQSHFITKKVTGMLDYDTYNILLSHYNELLTNL